MSEGSARFGLPLLAAGQAQKEITHNEALALIDGLLHAAVEGRADAPPAAPAAGDCWLAGPEPSGAWAGRADALALWTEGGWRFVAPRAGMRVWLKDRGVHARWTGEAWEAGALRGAELVIDGVRVVGPQAPAVAAPAGGAVVDAEARATLGAVLNALRAHGLIAR